MNHPCNTFKTEATFIPKNWQQTPSVLPDFSLKSSMWEKKGDVSSHQLQAAETGISDLITLGEFGLPFVLKLVLALHCKASFIYKQEFCKDQVSFAMRITRKNDLVLKSFLAFLT